MRKLLFAGTATAMAASVLACTYPSAVGPSLKSAATTSISYPSGYETWKCGNTSSRMILTFDDDPHQFGYDSVLKMGQYLKDKSIRAMFFLTTEPMNAASRTDVVAKLRAQGHYVANHSYDHPDFYKISDTEFRRQVNLGVKSNMLRPPFGGYTQHQKEIAASMGYRICTWKSSLSTHDWDIINKTTGERRSVASIRQIMKDAPTYDKVGGGGGVNLGHLWTNYPAAIPGIIDDMHAQGHLFCRNTGPVPSDGTIPFPLKCT